MFPARLVGRPVVACTLLTTMLMTLSGCNQDSYANDGAASQIRKLTIITPHNQRIRYAFAAGFSRWYHENRDQLVHVEWVYRGTPQCVSYIESIPEIRAQGGRYTNPDVFFGGGITDHGYLAEKGYLRSAEVTFPDADVPATINGIPTRDPENRWFATGLSSFGILYNQQACAARGVDPPTTWADLADPRFFSWLGIADPRASGSHRECLVLTLQQLGWAEGWPVIVKMLGNSRALSGRSGDALQLVETGHALATFAVNFDGLSRVAASDGRLAYVDPPGATVVTPDIISVLSTAQERTLAREFVNYVLSEEGQALWIVAEEHRSTSGATLYHYPINATIYDNEAYAGKLSVERNPFETGFGMEINPQQLVRQGQLLRVLIPALTEQHHIPLQHAWARINDAGDPAALAKLTALPFQPSQITTIVEELADSQAATARQQEWSEFFSGQLSAVADSGPAALATPR